MDKLKSRKLWVAVVSGLLVIANQGFGMNIPQDAVISLSGIVMSYILGQAYVDAQSK